MRRMLRAAATLLIIGAAVAPPAAAAIASPTYTGKTSKGKPVQFTVSGTKVSGKLEWTSTCGGAGSLTETTNFKAKYSGGKFKGHGSYTSIISFHTFHFTYKIAGDVDGSKASGTFSATGTTTGATCPSGSLTWTAKG